MAGAEPGDAEARGHWLNCFVTSSLGGGLPARKQEPIFTPQQPPLFSVPLATAALPGFSGKPFSAKMIVDPLDLGELTGTQLLATDKKGKWESILIFGENNQMASGPRAW